jgi:Domain of unknown function (DUF5597)/Beta-galactosidase
MNFRNAIWLLIIWTFPGIICQCQVVTNSPINVSDIPHLRKQGSATQLIVDGKPFLVLAGELGNNTATSLEYMTWVWPKLIDTKLNSVLAAVSWAQIEPEEGKFDFSVLDGVIQGARRNNLRLVLLWFGSWKNGESTYAPDWVKRDFERFPRLQQTEGVSVEVLTPFSDANRDADASAFKSLMHHIRSIDGQKHTVIMIQVENEIGSPGGMRDHSPSANKAFDEQVPKGLIDYLQQHKDSLIPELKQVWEAKDFKTSGTWEEVFGKCNAAEEIFMAWNFASYVGIVADMGKSEYTLPMYVNGWVFGFSKDEAHPNGACGSPMADLIDIWRAAAPRIDMISPDIYDFDYMQMCARYNRSGNPLFIPETRGFPPNNLATRVLYAFGRHDAIGFSPMGIERPLIPDIELTSAYNIIKQLAPLISSHQGDGRMSAVLIGANEPPRKVTVGDYTLEVSYIMPRVQPPAVQPQPPFPNAAAIFIETGPEEFYAAGTGVNVKFSPNTPGPPLVGLATVEEGVFIDDLWVPGRRLAGDDTGSRSLVLPRIRDIADNPALFGPSQKGIQRVTLYRYR